MKDKDVDEYYSHTKNLRVTFSLASPSTKLIIPDVVPNAETYNSLGGTDVYIGVSQI